MLKADENILFNFKRNPVFDFRYVYSYWMIINLFLIVFKNILKKIWISDAEYDPSGNSNLSFYVGADILNLLLL